MYVVVLLVFLHEFSIFDEEESMNQQKKPYKLWRTIKQGTQLSCHRHFNKLLRQYYGIYTTCF